MGPRIQFDFSSFDRRQWFMTIGAGLVFVAAVAGLIMLLAGTDSTPDEPEAAEVTASPTPSPLPTASPIPSATAGPTHSPVPQATATLEPYEYTVQPGDTLYYILGLFGYRQLDVVPEVLRINNMADENDLQADQTIIIPRQTPTLGPTLSPTPTPGEGTPTTDPDAQPEERDWQGCGPDNLCLSPDGRYWMHEVVADDTCAQLARDYNTTVPDVLQENNLTESCFIVPGDILQILIKVTLTPTLTPTGGPDSTATPTPTISPPFLLAPINGATIARGEPVILQWAANRPLDESQYYMVVVRSAEGGEDFRSTTRTNILRLPEDLAPGPGESITYTWLVVIVDGQSTDSVVISGQGEGESFVWGS